MTPESGRKPGTVFAIIATLLVGGVAFSRFANAGEVEATNCGNTVAIGSHKVASLDGTTACVEINRDIPIGEGEIAALRKVEDAAASSPDQVIAVRWTEIYRGRRKSKEVDYDPAERVLRCAEKGEVQYQYQPVSVDGIRAAVANGGYAAFANANLLSLPRSSFR